MLSCYRQYYNRDVVNYLKYQNLHLKFASPFILVLSKAFVLVETYISYFSNAYHYLIQDLPNQGSCKRICPLAY